MSTTTDPDSEPLRVPLSDVLGPCAAPRVEACIAAVMARHPGASLRADARYYEAVHQELAPLARSLERELAEKTELADSEGTRAVQYLRRARKAEAALRELVALKDLKDRLHELHEMGHGTDYGDYHKRQPLAWAAARDILGPNDGTKRAATAQPLSVRLSD